ncbi:hypothetical protein [Neptunicella marina]|uniref:Uncharacterized protein n=1 Tax=Neptunicella marina TaxID=2125989 RepID=A0A8J6IV64_9ALTE|nr:hypothetical protein [Neptunicella marina]MBC3766804.1 hypothetical protein [Neptunicella marina]
MLINEYFDDYCRAFNLSDGEYISACFNRPAIFMEGKRKTIFTTEEEVGAFVKKSLENYRKKQVVRADIEIQQVIRLASDFMFCKIIWWFYGQDGRALFQCPISYTMQMDGNNVTHIVALVKDKDHPVG